ncbi:MAG: ATP/GTP-binding protein [Pseudonocardiales bacterium]|nr:MAG: ATP/GTP-binding protein [Pseudonocardiales bacterium]
MSRRANRRRPVDSPLDVGSALRGVDQVESAADGDWIVRPIAAAAATKDYRCPGCDHEIYPATPHLVAWRVDGIAASGGGGPDERRHWHKPCWAARGRRGVTVQRSRNAPRHG